MMSWPSLNRSASTTSLSPTSRLTGYRPPSSSGVTLSMTTVRNEAGVDAPGSATRDDPLALTARDVLRGAGPGPADAGAATGAARSRDAGFGAGVVTHSASHAPVAAVAVLSRPIAAAGGGSMQQSRRAGPALDPGRRPLERVDQQIVAGPTGVGATSAAQIACVGGEQIHLVD